MACTEKKKKKLFEGVEWLVPGIKNRPEQDSERRGERYNYR